MADPAIRIRGLTKIFGRDALAVHRLGVGLGKTEILERHQHVLALRDVDLDVAQGTVQAVMGLSGSGKSTLVRHVNRLIVPTEGSVSVDGRDVLAMSGSELREFRQRRVSMVFQRFALMPHRTVAQNVSYGLKVSGLAGAALRSRADEWIGKVGLAGFEDRYPAELSGGMQQRVGLARALATQADILLMDEAFSALDPVIRSEMQSLLLGLQAELRRTIVFITHDFEEALRLGDRIAILKDGEIVQESTGQDIVLHPVDAYVAAFVREVDRSRIVELRTVMSALPSASVPNGGLVLPASTRLNDAARLMSETRASDCFVADEQGTPVGRVNLLQLVAAMVRPE